MAIGLRERKKAATRARIIACAVQMFREQGYEASRIEDIAEAADLSVATFYNYFGSKADMLLATVLTETEVIVKAVDECIEKPHTDLKKAFSEIVSIYFSMSFQMTSRELWREALARVFFYSILFSYFFTLIFVLSLYSFVSHLHFIVFLTGLLILYFSFFSSLSSGPLTRRGLLLTLSLY